MTTGQFLTHWFRGRPLGAVAFLLLVAGCARDIAVVLHQPFATPCYRRIRLEGSWNYSRTDVDRQENLLAFPLPGAGTGPRDFLIYISRPIGEGEFHVDAESPDGVRGFLIQKVGRWRGKTNFEAGHIVASSVPLKSQQTRLELALRCQDETTITGEIIVEEIPDELRRFTRKHAADIELLNALPESDVDVGDETSPRGEQP